MKPYRYRRGRTKNSRSEAYEEWREDNVYVHEFGSTDEGGSFYVETDGLRIFHAGDLNHWHWDGDTEADRREADKLFAREMSRLDIGETDLAFFL